MTIENDGEDETFNVDCEIEISADVDADTEDGTVTFAVPGATPGELSITIKEPERSLNVSGSDSANEPPIWYADDEADPANEPDPSDANDPYTGRVTITLTTNATSSETTTAVLGVSGVSPNEFDLYDSDGVGLQWDQNQGGYLFEFDGTTAEVLVTARADNPDKNTGAPNETRLNETARITVLSASVGGNDITELNGFGEVTFIDRTELVFSDTVMSPAKENGPVDGGFTVTAGDMGKKIIQPIHIVSVEPTNADDFAIPGIDYQLFRREDLYLPNGNPKEPLGNPLNFTHPPGTNLYFFDPVGPISGNVGEESYDFIVRPLSDSPTLNENAIERAVFRIVLIEGEEIQATVLIEDADSLHATAMIPQSDDSDCSCSCTTCPADGVLVRLFDGSASVQLRGTGGPSVVTDGTHGLTPTLFAEIQKPTGSWPTSIIVTATAMDANENEQSVAAKTVDLPSGFSGPTFAFALPLAFPVGDFPTGSYEVEMHASAGGNEWKAQATYTLRNIHTRGAIAPQGTSTGGVEGEDPSSLVVPSALFPFLKELVTGATQSDNNGIQRDVVVLYRGDNSSSSFIDNGDGTYQRPAESLSELGVATQGERDQLAQLFDALADDLTRPALVTAAFRLVSRFGDKDFFDSSGTHLASLDRNGNATFYLYENQRLARVANPLRRETLYDYDVNGRIASITDFAGRVTSYTYGSDTGGSMWLEIQQPEPDPDQPGDAPVQRITYDAAGKPTEIEHTASGGGSPSRKIVINYDDWGRVDNVQRFDIPAGSSAAELLSTWTLEDNPQQEGLPASPEVNTYTSNLTSISALSRVARTRDDNGNLSTYQLDSRGRLLDLLDAEGNRFVYQRSAPTLLNDRGDVEQSISPVPLGAAGWDVMHNGGMINGVVAVFAYDDRSNVTAQSLPKLTDDLNEVALMLEWADYSPSYSIPQTFTNELGHEVSMPVDPLTGNVRSVIARDPTVQIPLYQNELDPLDANLDGLISPIDVLVVINELNFRNNTGVSTNLITHPYELGFKIDVSGDDSIAPNDIGELYNYFNGTPRVPFAKVQTRSRYTSASDGLPIGLLLNEKVSTGRVTDPNGQVRRTDYEYYGDGDDFDPAASQEIQRARYGLLESVTHSGGTSLVPDLIYNYDGYGNVVLISQLVDDHNTADENDDERRDWTFTYDVLGRRTAALGADPDGAGPLLPPLTKFAYDPFHNVIAVEQVNHTRVQPTGGALVDEVTSHVSFFEYDGMNRQTRTIEQNPAAPDLIPDADSETPGTQAIQTNAELEAYMALPFAWPQPGDTSGHPETSVLYDGNSNVVAVTEKIADGTTRTTAYEFDELDRLVKIVSPNPGSSVDTSIPGTRRNDLATNPSEYYALGETGGLITSFDHDGVGNTTRIVDALGNETFFHYDAWSRVTDIFESPLDGFTQDERDDLFAGIKPSRLETEIPIPVTHYVYTATAAGWTETVTDPKERQTTTQRDYVGRVVSITGPQPDPQSGTPTTNFTYYLDSRIATIEDAKQNVTSYEYDTRARLAKVIDPDPDGVSLPLLSPVTTFAYNQANELLETTDPLIRKTSYQYDGLGRQIKVVSPDPDGNPATLDAPTMSYLYDSAGNVLQMTDALTHSTTYGYDALFRRVQVTDANGDETAYAFDLVDRLKSLTDANNNLTQWNYNPLDQVESETNVFSNSRSYVYDAVGNTRRMTDRLGRVTAYDYDRRYRMTDEHWFTDQADYDQYVVNSAANPPLRTLSYGYDPLINNLTSASDPAASYSFTYDDLDRVDVETHNLTSLGMPVTLDYDFDLVGNFTSLESTIGGTADFRRTHELDNLYRVTGITQTDRPNEAQRNPVSPKHVSFTYDAASQLDTIARYGAGSADPNQLAASSDYDFDGMGRLTHLQHDAASGQYIASYYFAFNVGNQLTHLTHSSVMTYNNNTSESAVFAYDARNQLTFAAYGDGLGNRTFNYDENGNRELDLDGNPATLEPTSPDGTDNRVQTDGTFRFAYDQEGNRIAKFIDNGDGVFGAGDTAITQYAWDHRNRLTGITERAAYADAVETAIIDYEYDVFDRRIAKTIDKDGDGSTFNAYRDVYVYDGQHIALEFRDIDADNSDGGTDEPAKLLHRYLHGPSVDMVLADEAVFYLPASGAMQAGQVSWTLTDHQGSIRDVVGPTGGVIYHLRYDAFGNEVARYNGVLTVLSEPEYVASLFGYTGRERDVESDLMYYRARYYATTEGVFISSDPIGFNAGDANLYRYVGNKVTTYTDPSGLDEFGGELGGHYGGQGDTWGPSLADLVIGFWENTKAMHSQIHNDGKAYDQVWSTYERGGPVEKTASIIIGLPGTALGEGCGHVGQYASPYLVGRGLLRHIAMQTAKRQAVRRAVRSSVDDAARELTEALTQRLADVDPFAGPHQGPGRRLALGLHDRLDAFSKQVHGEQILRLAKDDPDAWKSLFYDLLNNKDNHCVFNLDGVDNVWDAIQRAASGRPRGGTEWELLQIYDNKKWWDQITFTEGGKVAPNPFE